MTITMNVDTKGEALLDCLRANLTDGETIIKFLKSVIKSTVAEKDDEIEAEFEKVVDEFINSCGYEELSRDQKELLGLDDSVEYYIYN